MSIKVIRVVKPLLHLRWIVILLREEEMQLLFDDRISFMLILPYIGNSNSIHISIV